MKRIPDIINKKNHKYVFLLSRVSVYLEGWPDNITCAAQSFLIHFYFSMLVCWFTFIQAGLPSLKHKLHLKPACAKKERVCRRSVTVGTVGAASEVWPTQRMTAAGRAHSISEGTFGVMFNKVGIYLLNTKKNWMKHTLCPELNPTPCFIRTTTVSSRLLHKRQTYSLYGVTPPACSPGERLSLA